MGWQHHPPRHAAARAALGVQAAHATLGMAPPHMPPSSPRHANAKRARPRHRGEPSHATAVTPCPVHAAPRTRPMPPMRTRPPPHATSALPGCSAPRLGSTPRASMLPRKNVPMANVAAHPGGLTHASRPTLPIKRHTDAPPPMQRVPSPCTRPRLGSPRSPRALERACCLGKACQWPASRLTPGGLTHASRPTLPIERHTDAPPPHATSALPGHSAPSRLVEEPSSERVLPPKGARRIVAMPISVLRRLHSLLPCAGQESPPDESRFDA